MFSSKETYGKDETIKRILKGINVQNLSSSFTSNITTAIPHILGLSEKIRR